MCKIGGYINIQKQLAAKCASYDGTESYLKLFMPVSL